MSVLLLNTFINFPAAGGTPFLLLSGDMQSGGDHLILLNDIDGGDAADTTFNYTADGGDSATASCRGNQIACRLDHPPNHQFDHQKACRHVS